MVKQSYIHILIPLDLFHPLLSAFFATCIITFTVTVTLTFLTSIHAYCLSYPYPPLNPFDCYKADVSENFDTNPTDPKLQWFRGIVPQLCRLLMSVIDVDTRYIAAETIVQVD